MRAPPILALEKLQKLESSVSPDSDVLEIASISCQTLVGSALGVSVSPPTPYVGPGTLCIVLHLAGMRSGEHSATKDHVAGTATLGAA